jgi:hypothetical protein
MPGISLTILFVTGSRMNALSPNSVEPGLEPSTAA